MSQILVYSRATNKQVNDTIEMICEKLNQIGHNTEQTFSTNWARIFLNNYDVIHLFIEKFPMTVNELFFVSLAKALRKPTILSVFNSELKLIKPLAAVVCPDAITVSQTNHFQYYRDWLCSKSVLPLFPNLKNLSVPAVTKKELKNRPLLIPLDKKIEEVFQYKTQSETYFDGRQLLNEHTATKIRKKWNQFLQTKKINAHDHLILSDQKISELLTEENLKIILAAPHLKHTEFTNWLELTLNRNHCLFINDFQATGFSHAWTSGRNCQVIAAAHWPQSLNQFEETNHDTSEIKSKFKSSELIEPLMNEISRLYTKIIRQNTSLISSDSVKIKK